jgi:fatty acid desaturase
MSVYQRVKASDLFTPEELDRVRHSSDLLGVLCVAHAWLVIAGAMALTAWQWWLAPLAFVIIGARQLGLAILMHDAAHGILTKSKGLNDFLGQWFLAYPVGTDLIPYRVYHLKHHRSTQQADDPDLELSRHFPITRESFRRKLIRDITGQTGYQQRKAAFTNVIRRRQWGTLAGWLGTNAVILGACIAAGYWWLYPVLWVGPILTWFQLITRVRNIAEHAVVPDNNDPYRNARTTMANPLARALLAPYWVNYHVEHHLLFWVPCYRLPLMHKILKAKGITNRMEVRPGYIDVIRQATSRPTGAGGAEGGRGMRRRNTMMEGQAADIPATS